MSERQKWWLLRVIFALDVTIVVTYPIWAYLQYEDGNLLFASAFIIGTLAFAYMGVKDWEKIQNEKEEDG